MLHIELLNNAWTVLFTWIGTTTAMVGAAYFVSTRIKISLLVAMLCLYSIFSAACAAQAFQTWRRILGIGEDLIALQASGVKLSHSANLLIANLVLLPLSPGADLPVLKARTNFVAYFPTSKF
jgi:hypothetical protein